MHELPWYWSLLGGMLGATLLVILMLLAFIRLMWTVADRLGHDGHE